MAGSLTKFYIVHTHSSCSKKMKQGIVQSLVHNTCRHDDSMTHMCL